MEHHSRLYLVAVRLAIIASIHAVQAFSASCSTPRSLMQRNMLKTKIKILHPEMPSRRSLETDSAPEAQSWNFSVGFNNSEEVPSLNDINVSRWMHYAYAEVSPGNVTVDPNHSRLFDFDMSLDAVRQNQIYRRSLERLGALGIVHDGRRGGVVVQTKESDISGYGFPASLNASNGAVTQDTADANSLFNASLRGTDTQAAVTNLSDGTSGTDFDSNRALTQDTLDANSSFNASLQGTAVQAAVTNLSDGISETYLNLDRAIAQDTVDANFSLNTSLQVTVEAAAATNLSDANDATALTKPKEKGKNKKQGDKKKDKKANDDSEEEKTNNDIEKELELDYRSGKQKEADTLLAKMGIHPVQMVGIVFLTIMFSCWGVKIYKEHNDNTW